MKNYDGSISPSVKKILNTNLIQEIRDLKEVIRRKDMEIDVANEQVEMIKTNLPAYMKKNVFSIMEQATPIIEKLMPDYYPKRRPEGAP
jgi:protein tyrosine/serine phosphatase